jgi:hypothetical protein
VIELRRNGRTATIGGDAARKLAKSLGEIHHEQENYDPQDPTNTAQLPDGHTLRPRSRTTIDKVGYDSGTVGAIVDTPGGPRARLAITNSGDEHKFNGGQGPAVVDLDVATIDAMLANLDQMEQLGHTRKVDFDQRVVAEDEVLPELSELDNRHKRWIRAGDETARLTEAEQIRRENLQTRYDAVWDGFGDPDDTFMTADFPTPWGTLVMHMVGEDDGEGGWQIQLAVRPLDADDEWDINGQLDSGWQIPKGLIYGEESLKQFRKWLRQARKALAEAA